MAQYISDITSLSSKGQLVFPKVIRESLEFETGAKFMVLTDGRNILLKPIKQPDMEEFESMLDKAKHWATDNGLTEEDVRDAVRTVRRRRIKKPEYTP